MGILTVYGRLTDLPVANCNEIDSAIINLKNERDRTISDAEIDQIASNMITKLNKSKSTAESLKNAVKEKSKDLAIKSLTSTIDILYSLAIFSGNPKLIGSAGAIKLVTDTSIFAVQVTDAEDQLSQVSFYALNRMVMMVEISKSYESTTPSERVIELGKNLSRIGFDLTETTVEWLAVKSVSEKAIGQLNSLEANYAPALINSQATKKYRLAVIKGQIAYLEMIKRLYNSANCKPNIPIKPIPLG